MSEEAGGPLGHRLILWPSTRDGTPIGRHRDELTAHHGQRQPRRPVDPERGRSSRPGGDLPRVPLHAAGDEAGFRPGILPTAASVAPVLVDLQHPVASRGADGQHDARDEDRGRAYWQGRRYHPHFRALNYHPVIPVVVTTLNRLQQHGADAAVWRRLGRDHWRTLKAAPLTQAAHRRRPTRRPHGRSDGWCCAGCGTKFTDERWE